MNPCKKCLVLACCSTDCDEFKKYKEVCISFYNLLSITISLIVIGILFIYLKRIDLGMPFSISLLSSIWILTACSNVLINIVKHGDELNEIILVLFAPFIFCYLIQIHLYSLIFNRSVRKRV